MPLSRRSFARLLGTSGAALTLPGFAQSDAQSGPSQDAPAPGPAFPAGFLWGSATASYQVEGAVKEGGRGVSIWDTFAHTPGKTHNGDSGDQADDFYHLYTQDIALMKDLGLKTFRFSVAWSRIFPNGSGQPNQAGIDFYRRLTEALVAAGIQPFCTLFHWDLPQVLQDKGGWQNPDTSRRFADYAGYTAAQLAPTVRNFMTMNEMSSFVELGYGNGIHAPGLKLAPGALAQVRHNAVLGHGLAVRAIRAHAPAGTRVGLAENATAATPVIAAEPHIAAARKAYRELNAPYLTVVQEGRYTDQYLHDLGPDAPHFTPEEMRIIGSPLDFVGLNVYTPEYVRADDSEKGYAVVPFPKSFPTMFSPWLHVGPEALFWSPTYAHELWNLKEIYITENGCSEEDVLTPDGHVYDTGRTMFLRNYLTQLQRAVAAGVPVKGYFLWSLLDNYEWADGYEKRFGIVYVDFATEKRTPKLSAHFYKDVIRQNRVL